LTFIVGSLFIKETHENKLETIAGGSGPNRDSDDLSAPVADQRAPV